MSYIVIGKSSEYLNIIKIFAGGLESLALCTLKKLFLCRLLKCGSTGCVLFLEVSRQKREINIAKNCLGKVF
jgi:hypothetical protein